MKKQNAQGLIYARYILPPVLILLMLAAMVIPSYLFVIDGQVADTISAFALAKNSYDQSRTVLFGTAEQTEANLLFAKILLSYLIISVLLFVVALAVAIYCAVVAIRYFASDDEEAAERSRTLFITFFPNRIVVCVLEALVLPLLFLPYIMDPLYKSMFGMKVVLILSAPDALIIGGVLLLAVFVLSAICAPKERSLDADIFKNTRLHVRRSDNVEEEEDYTPQFSASAENDGDEQREKNRRIRELFDRDNKDNL